MKTRQVPTVKTDSEAAESFAQYLKFWTEVANDLNPRKVEELADKKGAQVSGSKVSSAINGLVADHRMRTLEAIALAIGRPPEEVYLAALGYYPTPSEWPDFKESDFAHLWLLYNNLPGAERKIYRRYVQMLANDIQRISNQAEE